MSGIRGRLARAAVAVLSLGLLASASPVAHAEGTVASDASTTAGCTPADPVQLGRRLDVTRSLALRRLAAADVSPYDRYPARAADGAATWARTGSAGWTAGFYPAMLWQAYAATRDPAWLLRARRWTAGLFPEAHNTGTHDLGFVIDTTAGRGASLDPDPTMRARYRAVLVTAADTLALRWNPTVGAIKSGEYDGRWGVIIDSAMNMPLLFDAASFTSDATKAARLRSIAVAHLHRLASDFIRADGSTFHRLGYDPVTGALTGALAGQGASPASTWSRGQAWALYGFATGYARTGDPALLAAARKVAAYWLAHQPADCVPWWDLSAPGAEARKDSSAGAIAAAGLLALAAVEPDPGLAAADRRQALATLARLTVAPYLTVGTTSPALLRRATTAVGPTYAEGSFVYGDHYLLDAAMRASSMVPTTPSLSLTATAVAHWGAVVPLGVRLSRYDGRPAAANVVVEALPYGARQWRQVTRATTSASGSARPLVRPAATTRYRLRLPATGLLAGVVTTAKIVTVTPAVDVALSRPKSGRAVLTGVVRPPRGVAVALQQRVGSRWLTLGKRTPVKGHFQFQVTQRGTARLLRIQVIPATPAMVSASSTTLRLAPR
jgi:hypothetical protein